MKNNNKGVVNVWLVVLIVVIALAAGYFAFKNSGTSTPQTEQPQNQVAPTDETAGWKTYHIEEYNFEFKYPSSWKLELDATTEEGSTAIFSDGTKEKTSLGFFMAGAFPKIGGAVEVKVGLRNIKEESVDVLNMAALKITGITKRVDASVSPVKEFDVPATFIVFEKSGKTYAFGGFAPEEIINLIVNTLKFL